MANRENLSVSFTPEQAAFLAKCVASGRFQTISEVVRASVREYQDKEDQRHAKLERARALIAEGARDIENGDTVSSEEFFAKWNERHDVAENAEAERSPSVE